MENLVNLSMMTNQSSVRSTIRKRFKDLGKQQVQTLACQSGYAQTFPGCIQIRFAGDCQVAVLPQYRVDFPSWRQMHPQIRRTRSFACADNSEAFDVILNISKSGGIQQGHCQPAQINPQFNDISGRPGDFRYQSYLSPGNTIDQA